MLLTSLLLSLPATLALPPARAAVDDGNATALEDPVPWFQGPFSNALGKARAEDKLVFLYVWASTSDQCVRLYGETLTTPEAAAELDGFVCFAADAVQPTGQRLVQRFGVQSLPTMLVVCADGTPEDAILGFIPTDPFVAEIRRIKQGQGTVSDLTRQIEADPDDLDLHYRLAVKLGDIGDRAGHDARIAHIRARDPEGATSIGAQLLLAELLADVRTAEQAATADLEPVRDFLRGATHRQVRFDGWTWIAEILGARGDRKGRREALREAWSHVPETDAIEFGNTVAIAYWLDGAELKKPDKRFALEVALRVVELTEQLADPTPPETVGERTYDQFLASRLDTLALCYDLNAQHRQAVTTGRRALALNPEDEELKRHLADFEKR